MCLIGPCLVQEFKALRSDVKAFTRAALNAQHPIKPLQAHKCTVIALMTSARGERVGHRSPRPTASVVVAAVMMELVRNERREREAD